MPDATTRATPPSSTRVDPTALVELIGRLSQLVGRVSPDLDARPTPCDDFDVAGLRAHLIGWLRLLGDALEHPSATTRPDPDDVDRSLTIGEAVAEVDELARRLSDPAGHDVASGTITVTRLAGSYSPTAVLAMIAFEVIVHGWDLGRAAGQPWDPDPTVCDATRTFMEHQVKAEYRGPGMPFGYAVEVPAGAGALDALVAFAGRDPRWTPIAR